MTTPTQPTDSNREWKLIEKMLLTSSKEQKSARRWGVFFKLLTFLYILLIFVFLASRGEFQKLLQMAKPHVGVIEINGPIMAGSGTFSSNISAEQIIKALDRAYDNGHVKAIILKINSPGGSPVQAGYVNDEIKRLRAKHPQIPVYAVITDIGASGAYYIAVAADKIFADKASLVGSIGVIHASFGFVNAIEKLGIERRILAAGENKAFLDPFLPESEEDKAALKSILAEVHQQFIKTVKEGRGDRLKADPKIFSGLVWSGEDAMKLGLVDDLSSTAGVARDIIGLENLVNYTQTASPIEQFMHSMANTISHSFVASVLDASQGGLK